MSAAERGASRGADYGLLIDRKRPLSFTFDGKLHSGFAGDVIASALYAEGRTLLSRSFKYHRPRGVLTMAGQDANTMVQVGAQPNVRADQHAIADGMAVKSINRLGPLDHDLYAGIGLFSRLLPVGFYYKTFFWPRGVWQHLFERPIRMMAGLGKLKPGAPHKYYDKAYLFADVLVVGGGPAGLEAAIAAAEAGADTLLIDDGAELGGSLLYGRDGGDRASVLARRADLVHRARATPNLRIMTGTTITGMFADNWASAARGNRFYKIRSKETVIATGAFDQPLVFRNNDRPGIMFADAAQRLMRLYGVKPGTRAVIATSNRFGYEAALDLLDAGVAVAAVVDLNATADSASAEAVRARGVRIIPGATLVDSKGRKRVASVAVARITGEGKTARDREWIDCDLVLMSVGFSPALNLASHAGAKVVYDASINMHRATDLPRRHLARRRGGGCVVASRRDRRQPACRCDRRGARPGALRGAAHAAPSPTPRPQLVNHPYPIFGAKGNDFIDFDEDLQSKDIVNTVKDGYDDIQLVKRYSTTGFGPSQGRHANLNTIRIVARETGKSIESIGTTTYRPPLVPEKFAALAGRGFEPVRHTAMHHRHVESWRADDDRRAVDAPRLLRTQGRCGARDRARGARRARRRRHDRRLDPRRSRHPRPGRRGLHRPHVHVGLREAADRPRALCADDRPDRRRHRRRRRRAPARAPLLRDGDDRCRRSGLPPDDLVQRAMEDGCRHRQRHRGVCRHQHRRPARARRDREARQRHRLLGGGIPLHGSAGGQARRHSGAHPARRLRRRARLRDPLPVRPRRSAVGPADGGRQAASASCRSASRRSASCGWRRATSSSARTPTA